MTHEKPLDSLRHQVRIVHEIGIRDATRVVALGLLMNAFAYITDEPTYVIIGTTCLIIAIQTANYLAYRFLPEKEEDTSLLQVLAAVAICFAAPFPFLINAVYLAALPDVAALMTALVIVFGVIVHAVLTYSELQIFNFAQLFPTVSAAYVISLYTIDILHEPATPSTWVVCIVAITAFMIYLFEARSALRNTLSRLGKAQQVATTRLRELEHLNQHDPLTGLFNRPALETHLFKILSETRAGSSAVVMVIDLNGFKPINDSYSHEAGDKVLISIAERLTDQIGSSGAAARVGGDEFIIALPSDEPEAQIMERARELSETLRTPIMWKGKMLRVTASIGVAITSDRRLTAPTICGWADQAMYAAKTNPDHAPVLYRAGRFARRATLEDRQALLQALDEGQVRPFYQPKIDLHTGRTVGFEALARWDRGNGKLVLPADFMPNIRDFGLTPDLMNVMTRQVLSDLTTWIEGGLNPGAISLNVSEHTLATRSGRQQVQELLAIAPQCKPYITLEITEDVFLNRSAEINRETIRLLRADGYRISLDDFGTGYASINHLRQIKIDELKIDASFVRDLDVNPSTNVLIGGILSMASALGIDVIAEGVEWPRQRDRLTELGCRVAQGFLWHEALTPDKARRLLIDQADAAPVSANAPRSSDSRGQVLQLAPRS